MPQINVRGGGRVFGTKDQRSEANYINKDIDAQNRQARQTAKALSDYNSKQLDMAARALHQEANYFNQQIILAARAIRQEADYFNRNFDMAAKQLRQAAEYENNLRDAQYKRSRALAEYENRDQDIAAKKKLRDADQTYRIDRSLAEYENREQDGIFKRRQQQADREYRRDRSLAEYENKEEDAKYRRQRAFAEYVNREQDLVSRKRQRDETQKYKTERSLAELENRDRDIAERKRRMTDSLRARADDKAYREARSLAEYENRNRDLASRKAAQAARAAGLSIFGTPAERYEAYEEDKIRARAANRPGFVGRMALGAARFAGGRHAEGALGHLMGYGGGHGGGGGYRGGMGVGMNDFGELGGAGMLGAGAVVATVVYEVVKAIAMAPQKYSSLLSGLVGSAAAYTGPAISAANMGRASGFSGSELLNTIYPSGMQAAPEWMRSRGITSPDMAMNILGAYGGPLNQGDLGPAQGKSILESVGNAFMMPYLGGLSHERYAQSLGLARQIGITNPQGGGINSTSKYASMEDYWREFQKTSVLAQTAGLDRSQVLNNIEALLRGSVTAGASAVNLGGVSDTWWRMASSGIPAGRTGELQMQAQQGQIEGVNRLGTGGGVPQNTALYMYTQRKFGGKIPTNLNAFASGFNIDINKQDSSSRERLSDAHKAFMAGNYLVGGDLLKSFLYDSGQQQTWLEMMSSGLGGLPDYAKKWALAGTSGLPTNAVYAGGNGQGRAIPESNGIDYSLSKHAGIRDRNPLNLSWTRGVGATGQDVLSSGYVNAVFGSMPEGVAADLRQLMLYQDRDKLMTVRQMVTKWVGDPNADLTSYIADVSKTVGVNPDEPINIKDPKVASAFIRAASLHESGSVAQGDIDRGVGLVLGPDNTPRDAAGKPLYDFQGNAGQAATQAGSEAATAGGVMSQDSLVKLSGGIVAVVNDFVQGAGEAASSAHKLAGMFDMLNGAMAGVLGGHLGESLGRSLVGGQYPHSVPARQ